MNLTDNFELSEFNCPDGTRVPYEYLINCYKLAVELQKVRDFIGLPIIVSSGYRTPQHNKKVGGVEHSLHLKALASDIKVKSVPPSNLFKVIDNLIDKKLVQDGGLFLYPSHVHYDIRGFKVR